MADPVRERLLVLGNPETTRVGERLGAWLAAAMVAGTLAADDELAAVTVTTVDGDPVASVVRVGAMIALRYASEEAEA